MLNEELLIDGCRKYDKITQKKVYDKYASTLLGIAMRYASNRAEAEDILQDGFLKIFVKIKQYSGKGSFEGWMKRIIVNTAIGNYRKNNKHYHHQDIVSINETEIDEFVYGDIEFTKEELMNVIADLPTGYRMVFNLFGIEGYKHKEIAQMMDIDITTSKSQFSRARKLIQKKLAELTKEKVTA